MTYQQFCLGCHKRGCVKGRVILRFYVCQISLKSAFVCVCARLFAFVCVCKCPLLLHPLALNFVNTPFYCTPFCGMQQFRANLARILRQTCPMPPWQTPPSRNFQKLVSKQRSTPHPLGAGSVRPNPKKGAPDTENPSCIRFTVLRAGLRPWSQTMVSEGAGPWVSHQRCAPAE